MSQTGNTGKGADHVSRVIKYYRAGESRSGYQLFLGGAKHFGYYDKGDNPLNFKAALGKMEDRLGIELNLPYGSLVLDAGCGMGIVARALASRFNLKIEGIDLLDFNIREAKKRSLAQGLDDKTHFTLGDYKQLHFPDSTFDGAYTMEAFVHSDDPQAVLAEFYRVLKPGGKLVMFEYSSTPKEELNPEAYAALSKICQFSEMPGMLELRHGVLEQKLAAAGFQDVKVDDISRNILPMLGTFAKIGKYPYLLGERLGVPEKVANAMSGVETFKHQNAWRYNTYSATKPRN